MFRLLLWLEARRKEAWFTPAIAVCLAVALVFSAKVLSPWVDQGNMPDILPNSIDALLTILATSMLPVATFSLGIMVSATTSAASNATPRATELVMSDPGTRRAIGSFIAAFIYAVVGKVALEVGFYGNGGLFILFVSTLGVLTYLVVSLVMWVQTLSTLGRLPDTLAKIEAAARTALMLQARKPWLGACPGSAPAPDGLALRCGQAGYLTHIDLATLQKEAQALNARFHLQVRPGAFLSPSTELMRLCLPPGKAAPGETKLQALREAFVIGVARSYDQDPRFGLIVLGEVGQRALSAAVNDPGTALQVMSILTRLLIEAEAERVDAQNMQDPAVEPPAQEFDCLTVPPMDEDALLTDSFDAISRDGAGNLAIAVRMQKLLHATALDGLQSVRLAARQQAARSLDRANAALQIDAERESLTALHQRLFLG